MRPFLLMVPLLSLILLLTKLLRLPCHHTTDSSSFHLIVVLPPSHIVVLQLHHRWCISSKSCSIAHHKRITRLLMMMIRSERGCTTYEYSAATLPSPTVNLDFSLCEISAHNGCRLPHVVFRLDLGLLNVRDHINEAILRRRGNRLGIHVIWLKLVLVI
jgi:hypothetical protein